MGSSFSARVPRSSAEVPRVFVHHILEDEVDGQKEGQGEDGEEGEVNGVVEEIRQTQRSHETWRCDGMSADPNLSHACAYRRQSRNDDCEKWTV